MLAVVAAMALGLGQAASAQQDMDRLQELIQQVESLVQDNAALNARVEELEQGGGEGGVASALAEIQEELGLRAPYGNLSNDVLLRPDGAGFVDHIVYGGEWRTRADYRHNTVDLLNDIDDDGFRLDFRFNLGLGFEWGVGAGGEDGGNKTKIRTWFEIQASGRAANNTAETIPSFAGVSIGDFSTRDNDLDQVRLYQAYISLEDIFSVPSLGLKIGRQEITLGSKLIMGTNEFYTGTVHDAIRLDYNVEALGNARATVFYAKEAASDGQFPPGIATGGLLASQFRASGDEDELVGVYFANSDLLDPVTVDVYYFYFNGRSAGSGIRPDNVTSASDPGIDAFGRSSIQGQNHTFGTWIRSDRLIDNFFFSLEVAYQVGKDDLENDLDSLLIEFLVEYNLPFLNEYAARVHAGYYFSEGPDSQSASGFSPLFISRHDNQPVHDGHGAYGRFGNIDLIPATNIHVFHLGFKFSPDLDQKWTLGLTYLYAVRNHSRERFTTISAGNIFLDDRQLGHEVDLYAVYQASAQIEMFFNATVFIPHADFIIERSNPPAGENPFAKFNTSIAIGIFAQIQIRF